MAEMEKSVADQVREDLQLARDTGSESTCAAALGRIEAAIQPWLAEEDAKHVKKLAAAKSKKAEAVKKAKETAAAKKAEADKKAKAKKGGKK